MYQGERDYPNRATDSPFRSIATSRLALKWLETGSTVKWPGNCLLKGISQTETQERPEIESSDCKEHVSG
jgi:hypothetical protein